MDEIERKFLMAVPASRLERDAAIAGTLKCRRLIQQRYFPTNGWKLYAYQRADGNKVVLLKSDLCRIEVPIESDKWDDLASLCEPAKPCRGGSKQRLRDLKNWTVRIRRSTDMADADRQFYLTLKRKVTMMHSTEIESRISEISHSHLAGHCGPTLRKRRIKILYSGRVWEIDTFNNPELNGLELAEVELPSTRSSLAIPSWAGPEVTEDRSYKNARIVQRISA